MPQYKYQVKKGVKWLAKFNYVDPNTGTTQTEYKRGFDSKREAKDYEENFLENLTAENEEEEAPYERTFEDVFQEYLMSHKREDIKESSLRTKHNVFEKHIFPTFRDTPIADITDDDIAAWQAKMKSVVKPDGKPLSKAFLRTIQSQFNSVINYAHSKGYLKLNPLADIKIWALRIRESSSGVQTNTKNLPTTLCRILITTMLLKFFTGVASEKAKCLP